MIDLKEFLNQHNACQEAKDFFQEKDFDIKEINNCKNLNLIIELANKAKYDRTKIVQLAIDCAKVVSILNDDPRVAAAIQIAEICLLNPTEENKQKCRKAAADVAAATHASHAAAYAAAYAATHASHAATYAYAAYAVDAYAATYASHASHAAAYAVDAADVAATYAYAAADAAAAYAKNNSDLTTKLVDLFKPIKTYLIQYFS